MQSLFRGKSDENRIRYKKRRNICVSLLIQAKRKHYKDLNKADVNDDEKIWKRVKPLFGNKIKGNPNITLVEGNYIMTDDLIIFRGFVNQIFVFVWVHYMLNYMFHGIVVPYNVLWYLPDNVLLYLALIRPVFFWCWSYCQAKLNQNNNQKSKTRGASRMKIFL